MILPKKLTFLEICKKIKNEEIYLQGAEGKFSYIFIPLRTTISMNELYGINYNILFCHIKNNYITNYFIKDKMNRIVTYFCQRQQKNQKFIEEVEEKWKALSVPFYEIVSTTSTMNLKEIELPMLISIYQKLAERGYEQWKPLIFIDAFDPFGEELLKKEIEKYNLFFHDKMGVVTYPFEMSYAQKEKLHFLKIASFVFKKGIVSSLLKTKVDQVPSEIFLMLKEHEKKFYWSRNNYAYIVYYDVNLFFRELQKLISENSLKTIEEQINKIEMNFEKSITEQQNLLKEFPKESQNIFYFFQKMTVLRDKRKQNNCILLTWLKLLSNEIAQRLSIEPHLLDNVVWWEMEQLLTNKKKYVEMLKNREEEALIIFLNTEEPLILTEKDASAAKKVLEEKMMKKDSELTGNGASHGKVVGRVRIIQKVEEFSVFQKGDILVTAMTRPEFLPIMEKAAAIVTDEGGITSHAAIVSRELGIPCIVGTQIATRILKDGMTVEVNATEGWVKIVKHQNSS